MAEAFGEKRKRGEVQGHGSGFGGSGFKFDSAEDDAKRQERKVSITPLGLLATAQRWHAKRLLCLRILSSQAVRLRVACPRRSGFKACQVVKAHCMCSELLELRCCSPDTGSCAGGGLRGGPFRERRRRQAAETCSASGGNKSGGS